MDSLQQAPNRERADGVAEEQYQAAALVEVLQMAKAMVNRPKPKVKELMEEWQQRKKAREERHQHQEILQQKSIKRMSDQCR